MSESPRGMLPVMPLWSPLYTVGSEAADLQWLTICYESEPSRIDAILPAPLEPAAIPEVLVWVAEFKSARFDGPSGTRHLSPYFQGGIAVRAVHAGVDVAYPLVSYITGLNHGFTGRELFGLPKKQAEDVGLHLDGANVEAHITASTVEGPLVAIKGRMRGRATRDSIVPEWFQRQRTIKLIPAADGRGYDVNQLVAVPFDFSETEGLNGLESSLIISPNGSDPLSDLPVGKITCQCVGRTSLRVGYGTYLGTPGLPTGPQFSVHSST